MEGCGEIWRLRYGAFRFGAVWLGAARYGGRGLERSGSVRYGLEPVLVVRRSPQTVDNRARRACRSRAVPVEEKTALAHTN